MIDPFTNPISQTYGEIVLRHLASARVDFWGERTKRLFELSTALHSEFREETEAWEMAFAAGRCATTVR